MRFRDRKASWAAVVLAAAYSAIILTGILFVAQILGVYNVRPLTDFLKTLLLINAGFLIWRLLMKFYFVFALYGLREALLSLPRTVVANVINILAAWRAMRRYGQQLAGRPLDWEKTNHFYPEMRHVRQLRSERQAGEGS